MRYYCHLHVAVNEKNFFERTKLMDTQSKQDKPNTDLIERFLSEQQDPIITRQVYDRVSQILTRDEEINYIAVQKPLVSMTPDSVVLTNRRLIVYRPKMFGRVDFDDFIWRDLSDAKLKEGMMNSTLTFKTMQKGILTVDNLPKTQARKLYSFAQEKEEEMREERRKRAMEEKRAAAGGINIQGMSGIVPPVSQQPSPSIQKPEKEDPMEVLKKLKALLEADLITQQEYDAKKADLLAKM